MELAASSGGFRIFLMLISAVFCNNFVLARFLGCCPFLGVSKTVGGAVGMGLAVTFVMGLASLFTTMVQLYILNPLNMAYMQTIAFILVIAALVQFVEMFMKKAMPPLYRSLGIYLPLITTNCAVLGVTILNINSSYGLLESVLNGVFSALGFLLAIVLMAGINERLATAKISPILTGFPISLVTAGLMSIAFLGFSGMIR
ncbi:MAG: RnfABCDGE type electron transport complex subunit A [Peptococcaceae bacterium]|jgi:electron transport complex protein RnfA|nr:RnfABCDGE type electron transport complex subunit A [Peptococcaceae bacterium]